MKKFAVLMLAALAGCASVNETYAPDGRKAYALNCSGTARGWDKCLSAAGDLCGAQGYDVLDRNGENMAIIGGGNNGFLGTQTAERSMVIACRK